MVDMKFWKLYDFRISLYSTVFEVADYEFKIGFSEFKMADIIIWKPNDFVELSTPRFFRSLITNLTSDFRN